MYTVSKGLCSHRRLHRRRCLIKPIMIGEEMEFQTSETLRETL